MLTQIVEKNFKIKVFPFLGELWELRKRLFELLLIIWVGEIISLEFKKITCTGGIIFILKEPLLYVTLCFFSLMYFYVASCKKKYICRTRATFFLLLHFLFMLLSIKKERKIYIYVSLHMVLKKSFFSLFVIYNCVALYSSSFLCKSQKLFVIWILMIWFVYLVINICSNCLS